ncbi:B3 domain-containing protein Os08g0324300 [Linum grandiflorum]
MEKQQLHETPSFGKVFHGGLVREMKIPAPFVNQHSQLLPEKLVLMPKYGNAAVVSVERRTKSQYFFTVGWSDFVMENSLEEGDYVFFYFDGDRAVDVIICNSLGHLKGVKETEQGGAVAAREVRKWVKRDAEEKLLEFQTVFKPYMQTLMDMPVRFSDAAELKVGGDALLQDPTGKVWAIRVIAGDPEGRKKRFSAGWTGFIRGNGVEAGDRLSFFLKTDFIQVTILKEGVKV